MNVEINVNSLSNLLKEENKTGEIITLEPDFYAKVHSKLQANKNPENDEYKNILKIYELIRAKRLQKVLVYLAYNKEIPHPIPSEEEGLYIQIRKIISSNNNEPRGTQIKIVKTVPQIITPKGSKIGPFEQNQIIYISDLSDAKFIVDNKLGEIVN